MPKVPACSFRILPLVILAALWTATPLTFGQQSSTSQPTQIQPTQSQAPDAGQKTEDSQEPVTTLKTSVSVVQLFLM